MNDTLSEDQPAGRGGAITQTGKPPWGGKGGLGTERDQSSSQPDPKAPMRSRRRPASFLFSSRARGPRDEKHAGSVRHRGPAPRYVRGRRSVVGGRLDREDALLEVPAGPGAEVVRRGAERPAELQQGGEARFAPGPLQKRDLGPVQVGPFAELLLRDPDRHPAAAKVLGEALLRGQFDRLRCRCLSRVTRASSRCADNRSTDKRPPPIENTDASATLMC